MTEPRHPGVASTIVDAVDFSRALAYPIEASVNAAPHKDRVAIDIAVARAAPAPLAGRLLTSVIVGEPAIRFEDRLAIAARIVRTINGSLL